MYIHDSELRANIKPYRDSIMKLLQYHLPKSEFTAVGDTEIQMSWHANPSLIRETALECDMYGDWNYVESQWESFDNYHYSTDLNLKYYAPVNEVVNALMKLIKS